MSNKKKEHIDFILANYKHLTVGDMAEELELAPPYVWLLCKENNVKAITPKEQARKYILAMYQKLSQSDIASRLNFSEETMEKVYRKLGIREPEQFREQRKKRPSAPKILSNYQFYAAAHYPIREATTDEVWGKK
jgi:hypothetical protein